MVDIRAIPVPPDRRADRCQPLRPDPPDTQQFVVGASFDVLDAPDAAPIREDGQRVGIDAEPSEVVHPAGRAGGVVFR